MLSEIKFRRKMVQDDISCTLKKSRENPRHHLPAQEDRPRPEGTVMHGWRGADGITTEEARKLPEPKVYDGKFRICTASPDGFSNTYF
ncbi:MAG: hypothetical protein ACK4GQ_02400 [Candidatus Hadarchaeales archaeon]